VLFRPSNCVFKVALCSVCCVWHGRLGVLVELRPEFSWQKKQDAQLSQRDRAAGCVIVFAKSRTLEL